MYTRRTRMKLVPNFRITVKLGYSELDYNEQPVIANKLNIVGWF